MSAATSSPPKNNPKAIYYVKDIPPTLLSVTTFAEFRSFLSDEFTHSEESDKSTNLLQAIFSKFEDLLEKIEPDDDAGSDFDDSNNSDDVTFFSINDFTLPLNNWLFVIDRSDETGPVHVAKILFENEMWIDTMILRCMNKVENSSDAERIPDRRHAQAANNTCLVLYYSMILDSSYSKPQRALLGTSGANLKIMYEALVRLRSALTFSPSSSFQDRAIVRNHASAIFNVILVFVVTRPAAHNFIFFPGMSTVIRELFAVLASSAAPCTQPTDSAIAPFTAFTRVICNICYGTKNACRKMSDGPEAVIAIISGLAQAVAPSVLLTFAQAVAAITWATTDEVKLLFATKAFADATLRGFPLAPNCRTIEHLCLIINNSTWESPSVTNVFCTEQCFSIMYQVLDHIRVSRNLTKKASWYDFNDVSRNKTAATADALRFGAAAAALKEVSDCITWCCGAVKNCAMEPVGMKLFSRECFTSCLREVYPAAAGSAESLLFLEVTLSFLMMGRGGGVGEDDNRKAATATSSSRLSFDAEPRGFGFGFTTMFNVNDNQKYKNHADFNKDKEKALEILKEAKIRMLKYETTLVIQYGSPGTVSAFKSLRVFFEDDNDDNDDEQEKDEETSGNEDDDDQDGAKPVKVNGKKDLEWIISKIDKK